jgi:MFS family permease
MWLGAIFGVGGTAGSLLGGYVASRWFADNEPGQMRMSAVAVAALIPCLLAFLAFPGKYAALLALLPVMLVFSFFLAPTYALMQRLVADDMRATMMAVVLLLANLVGMGMGPQIVGILSDLFKPTLGADSLRYAMLCVSLVALGGAWHFWKVGLTVETDLKVCADAR